METKVEVETGKILPKKGSRKESIFSFLQSVGHSFMLPISVLPIAGIFLGIGGSFSNPLMIESYKLGWLLGRGTFFGCILMMLHAIGIGIFSNMSLLFAIGVAIGMAKSEKPVAALSSFVSFITMHKVISTLLVVSGKIFTGAVISNNYEFVIGIPTFRMGIFGGILVGFVTAYLNNKFYKTKLPNAISFFGGTRFVPIISVFAHIFIGLIMFFTWPFFQNGLQSIGSLVAQSGYVGTFIYGLVERALIPFGLHHVFYMPFWTTAIGGTAIIDGKTISGAYNILFSQLVSVKTVKFSVEAARFFGKYPFMVFGLPGAALAMYSTANSSKKKLIGGLLFSAALTSLITGITEPIEFTFLFVAPMLYGIHCVLAGLSFMICHMLKITTFYSFSSGLIDLILFGVLQGNAKTSWMLIIPVGLVYFAIYFFLFKYLIEKYNLKTPGREENEAECKLYTKKDFKVPDFELSKMIVNGLGGPDNIEVLSCCITRLRVKVKDEKKVEDDILIETGASGVVRKGDGIQVIYGPRVSVLKSGIEDYIRSLYSGI
jgi:PTS system D-glucosamine-specific IIC component